MRRVVSILFVFSLVGSLLMAGGIVTNTNQSAAYMRTLNRNAVTDVDAAYFNPALTTVDQFVEKMGHVATEKLVSLIQGQPLDEDLYKMPTELIVRDSCRAVAGHGPGG